MKHRSGKLLAPLLAVLNCQAQASYGDLLNLMLGLMVPAGVATCVALAYLIVSKAPGWDKLLALAVAMAAEVFFFLLVSSGAMPLDWHTFPLIAVFPIAGLFIAHGLLRCR